MRSSSRQQLTKYLRTRAITSPWLIAGSMRRDFAAAVVIPALAEQHSLPQTLKSLATNPAVYLQQTVIVIVINNRSMCAAEQFLENQHTLRWLQTKPFPELNLVWVDASSAGLELPAKQGVGLARKIGFDLVLSCLVWQAAPVLVALDADTLVDENYLSAIFNHFATTQAGGAVLPFRHQAATDTLQEVAIRHYELYLRSYLFGLQRAGSPYAYHTIGSAFACRAAAYLAAGGMNRRRAGEDFYFLQQLAKTGWVQMLCGTVVHPSSRVSDRVPFGTGRAVQGQLEEGLQLFDFSSAEAFSILRAWLLLVEKSLDQSAVFIEQQVAGLSGELGKFLQELGFVEIWTKLQTNYSTKKGRLTAFHAWFDGLRSRQLLARLTVGNEHTVEQRVAALLAWGGYPEVHRWSAQLSLLERLQQVGEN